MGQRAAFIEGRIYRRMNQIIKNHGGKTETSTNTKDKLQRQWLDAKATFANHTKKSIWGSTIYDEEWAQRAYHKALQQPDLP